MRRMEIPGDIRFVTFSCNHRLPLLQNPEIAMTCQEAVIAARARFRFERFAWVIMPEHAMAARIPWNAKRRYHIATHYGQIGKRFKAMFKKAGLSIHNDANLMDVMWKYHKEPLRGLS